MDERPALARDTALPEQILMQTSATYLSIAEKITGAALTLSDKPRAEILDILNQQFGVIE